jgi:hypothetical protein
MMRLERVLGFGSGSVGRIGLPSKLCVTVFRLRNISNIYDSGREILKRSLSEKRRLTKITFFEESYESEVAS